MSELDINWKKTLDILEPELSEVSYETWFLPLKPVKIDEKASRIYLKPTDEMHQSILTNRYIPVLETAIKTAFGKKYSVVFEFSDDISASSPHNTVLVKNFTDEFYLNPRYNFNSFVVGDNNKYAYAASVAVAEAPSEAYNPLFIYGGSGLGKTHLMHAIGHYILQNAPDLRVLYVSSEMFTNEFIAALEKKRMPEFRNKYRNLDVLLIDDIQFIGGKERIQEEFFYTFNNLHELNKQIIISSDVAPNKLQNIDDRLSSRFAWNIVADISNPDYETRVAILRKKAAGNDIEITPEIEEVIWFIAEKIKINIRELEGALIRVITFSNLMNEKIDLKFAKSTLKEILSSAHLKVTPDSVKKAVCKHFNIKMSDIESSKRTQNLAFPRQIAMYLCRETTDESLPKIGEFFGGRDHTTVLHAYQKISREIKTNETLKDVIDALQKELDVN
ncbi:MAG: chromosomal replication initiator protein DnaA [Clostridiales bacterium]|nr:chromosomal replication initiator protein DnaA [Clostridiales bacterium]